MIDDKIPTAELIDLEQENLLPPRLVTLLAQRREAELTLQDFAAARLAISRQREARAPQIVTLRSTYRAGDFTLLGPATDEVLARLANTWGGHDCFILGWSCRGHIETSLWNRIKDQVAALDRRYYTIVPPSEDLSGLSKILAAAIAASGAERDAYASWSSLVERCTDIALLRRIEAFESESLAAGSGSRALLVQRKRCQLGDVPPLPRETQQGQSDGVAS